MAILLVSAFFSSSASAANAGFLRRSGTQIVNDNGFYLLKGVNLDGWLYSESQITQAPFTGNAWSTGLKDVLGTDANVAAFYSAWRSNYVTQADVHYLKSLGMNSVRVPLDYTDFYDDTTGQFKEQVFLHIDNLLSWCADAGMYVILDMHSTPGGQRDVQLYEPDPQGTLFYDYNNQQKLIDVWQHIAARYAGNTALGGYDLINEPVIANGGDYWRLRDLYVRITSAIRAVDFNHLIFAEGNWWASDPSILGSRWDGNMAFSIHNYWTSVPHPAWDWQVGIANGADVPLWFGEFGENSNPWTFSEKNASESRGIGWCYWNWKVVSYGINYMLNASVTPEYQSVLNYWNGFGGKPSQTDAFNALLGMAQRLSVNYCLKGNDVIDALTRVDFSYANIPFAKNQIPGRVWAADYDMGNQWGAYNDAIYQTTGKNLDYTPWNNGGSSRNDGVDIGWSYDDGWGPYVGWTDAGEWITYTIYSSAGWPNIYLRYASSTNTQISIQIDSADLTGAINLPATGGDQSWTVIQIPAIAPIAAGTHTMRINVNSGSVSLRWLEFTGMPALPPTSLAAKAGNGVVSLSWTPAGSYVSFNIKRSTTPGGPYSILAGSNNPFFTDTTAVNGTTYYYVVSTVNSEGQSANSWEARATPGGYAVNAGGTAFDQFSADSNFSGGAANSTGNGIDTTGLASPAPQSVYQTERYGGNFSYTFTGLTPGNEYAVRLHFAEFFYTAPTQRVFNVSINGVNALTNFDIFAVAGGQNRATIQEFTGTANASGQIAIQFTAVIDNAKCSGIEILSRPPAMGNNLAFNKTATASSSEQSGYSPSHAVDANTGSRWSSQFSDPQWFSVDLGAAFNVNRVKLAWAPTAYGKSYQVQLSTDGINWTTATTITNSIGQLDDLSFASAPARYVRMNGTQRGSAFGYSLTELEAYGESIVPPGWTDRDVGNPALAGYGNFDANSGLWRLAAGGADVFGNVQQFHFVSEDLTGDGSIVAKVATIQNTNPWAKAGVMVRDANGRYAFVFVTPSSGVAFESSAGASYAAGSAPRWLKLTRAGNTFTAFAGTDGVNWTQLGGPQTISMAATMRIGLALTSHNYHELNVSTFSNVSVLPGGWSDIEAGNPGLPGGSLFRSAWNLAGSGSDIFGTNDSFQFAFKPVAGNCGVAARINGLRNTDPWAKVGVMIRDSTNATAKNAFVTLTPGNGVSMQWRDATGGTSTVFGVSADVAPYWLRLVRSGNTLTGYKSIDGNAWTQLNSVTISMTATAYVGLAISAHNNSLLTTAAVDNVIIATMPLAPATFTATPGNGQVLLTWSTAAQAGNYNVKRATTSGGPYTTITNVTGAAFTDFSVVNGTTYYYVVTTVNIAAESTSSPEISATPLSPMQNWLLQYFGSITKPSAAPTADADGDGLSNQDEFLAGTNPTNAVSTFKITSVLAEAENLRVNWLGVAGRTSILQCANAPTGNYSNLSANIILTSATTNYLHVNVLSPFIVLATNDAGNGFAGWTLTPANNTANSGWFIGASTNNGGGSTGIGNAWGAYANGGASASAVQSIGPMIAGQTFAIDMDNGFIEAGGSVGIELQNASAQNVLRVLYVGFNPNGTYSADDSTGSHNLGAPFTVNGLRISVKLTSATAYTLTLGTNVFSGTITGGPIAQVRLFNNNSAAGNSGAPWDAFWNNLKVTGGTNNASLFYRVRIVP